MNFTSISSLSAKLALSALSLAVINTMMMTKANARWQCPVGVPDPSSGQPNKSGVACAWVEDTPAINGPLPEPTKPEPSPLKLPPDPAMMKVLDSLVKRAEFEAKYGRILFYEPNVGIWLMTSEGDGTGKNCAVSFTETPKVSNIVLFSGPAQKGAGAILFQGIGMPATPEIKEIQPTLTFKGSEPAPINAALIPYGKNSGILVLTDMVGMMRRANAENEVTLQLDGKEVFRASMTGFMKARSAMLECMKAE
ncbi:hypothetical protein ACN4EG_08890 [Alkalinema pantanalense CENA528]|uniref:hypothetical protein n=1 Tax=Alkalinema pantanalense TaxID=1620705 RepID=UPI003D6F0947